MIKLHTKMRQNLATLSFVNITGFKIVVSDCLSIISQTKIPIVKPTNNNLYLQ